MSIVKRRACTARMCPNNIREVHCWRDLEVHEGLNFSQLSCRNEFSTHSCIVASRRCDKEGYQMPSIGIVGFEKVFHFIIPIECGVIAFPADQVRTLDAVTAQIFLLCTGCIICLHLELRLYHFIDETPLDGNPICILDGDFEVSEPCLSRCTGVGFVHSRSRRSPPRGDTVVQWLG